MPQPVFRQRPASARFVWLPSASCYHGLPPCIVAGKPAPAGTARFFAGVRLSRFNGDGTFAGGAFAADAQCKSRRFPPRDRLVPGLSFGRCHRVHRSRRRGVSLFRLLEGIRRRRTGTASVSSIRRLPQTVSGYGVQRADTWRNARRRLNAPLYQF